MQQKYTAAMNNCILHHFTSMPIIVLLHIYFCIQVRVLKSPLTSLCFNRSALLQSIALKLQFLKFVLHYILLDLSRISNLERSSVRPLKDEQNCSQKVRFHTALLRPLTEMIVCLSHGRVTIF